MSCARAVRPAWSGPSPNAPELGIKSSSGARAAARPAAATRPAASRSPSDGRTGPRSGRAASRAPRRPGRPPSRRARRPARPRGGSSTISSSRTVLPPSDSGLKFRCSRRLVGDPEGGAADRELGDHAGSPSRRPGRPRPPRTRPGRTRSPRVRGAPRARERRSPARPTTGRVRVSAAAVGTQVNHDRFLHLSLRVVRFRVPRFGRDHGPGAVVRRVARTAFVCAVLVAAAAGIAYTWTPVSRWRRWR